MDAHTPAPVAGQSEDREDTAQRNALGDVVSALGRQLKELATAAMPAEPAAATVRAPASGTTVWRTIKPTSHQRVAIDVHRDDWP